MTPAPAWAGADDDDAELVSRELRVRPSARVAILDDKPLVLTPVEFDLLVSLMRSKGRVKSREQLIERRFATASYDVFDRSIDVHISGLRRKTGRRRQVPAALSGRLARRRVPSSSTPARSHEVPISSTSRFSAGCW